MAQRRKRRTSIRTAAGVAQEKYLEKLRALAEDPTRVLPEVVGDEPKPITKLRAGIEKVASGKIGFFDKRDKGVLGAVAHSIPLAKLDSVPRLLDTKVAGKRRFFLQRGHVTRSCMLGVQNHDEPKALLMAYREMAKTHDLHFFATPRVWCTGSTPQPPTDWLAAIAKKAELDLADTPEGYALGPAEGPRVRLGFRGGPALDVSPKAAVHVHQLVAASYAGPKQRHPVEVHVVLPDGSLTEPGRDALASYRAGVLPERRLVDDCVAAWRKEQRGKGTRRYVLGETDYGTDQDAFLSALSPETWEEPALRALTEDGFIGRAKTAADVFTVRRDSIGTALTAFLDAPAARGLLQQHGSMPPRDLVRKAHDMAQEARLDATLPAVQGGPEVTFIDAVAHANLKSRGATLDVIRKALDAGKVPPGHVAAFLAAIGGDISLASRIDRDAAETGEHLRPAAEKVLDAEGDAYVPAIAAFLETAGSSDRPAPR